MSLKADCTENPNCLRKAALAKYFASEQTISKAGSAPSEHETSVQCLPNVLQTSLHWANAVQTLRDQELHYLHNELLRIKCNKMISRN